MRKKLLALLMCATMVLGTGVTAFAATSDSDAKKIGVDNAQLIIDEYYKAAGAITGTASNGTNGTVTYGYAVEDNSSDVLGEYTPVVVYPASGDYKAATAVEDSYNAFEVETAASDVELGSTFDAQKKALEGIFGKDAVKTMVKDDKFYVSADGETKAVLAEDDVIYSKAADGDFQTVLTVATDVKASYDAAVGTTAAITKAIASVDDGKAVAVTVYEANGGSVLYYVKVKTSHAVDSAEKTEYVSGTKLYVQKDAKKTLVTGSDKFLKSVDENKYGKIYSQLSIAGDDFVNDGYLSVKYAVDSKKFTKDAAAVKISAYVQTGFATKTLGLEASESVLGAGKAKALYNYTQIQAGSYTFDADLISRTAFGKAEAVSVFQPGIGNLATEYVADLGVMVVPFNAVATVAVDDTITFDSNTTWADGVFVFDKGELAAEEPTTSDNDGVSDAATTTAASANTSASPKTGDVAPIAALAVVMMGACGAMVVASKKRA